MSSDGWFFKNKFNRIPARQLQGWGFMAESRIPAQPLQCDRLGISLGFDSRAGRYKVLSHFYYDEKLRGEGFMVFLVGSSTESWRMIDFPLDVNKWTMDHLTWADGAWHFLCMCEWCNGSHAYDIEHGRECTIEGIKISVDLSYFKITHTNSLVRWNQMLTWFFKKMTYKPTIPHLKREVEEEVDEDECNNSLLSELNEDVVYEIISSSLQRCFIRCASVQAMVGHNRNDP
ncbi:hypothetical protein QJS10_CPB20g00231 [Acorus calamus]|uniref:F-box associated domain-containing protein n=1 Tax=Acorus calamus TaxID=4465 RepID=A0AAV9C9L6_ACOCL|nr:hypothetical protein QJS10_CPB20g00231 [Acorus calamus]